MKLRNLSISFYLICYISSLTKAFHLLNRWGSQPHRICKSLPNHRQTVKKIYNCHKLQSLNPLIWSWNGFRKYSKYLALVHRLHIIGGDFPNLQATRFLHHWLFFINLKVRPNVYRMLNLTILCGG